MGNGSSLADPNISQDHILWKWNNGVWHINHFELM